MSNTELLNQLRLEGGMRGQAPHASDGARFRWQWVAGIGGVLAVASAIAYSMQGGKDIAPAPTPIEAKSAQTTPAPAASVPGAAASGRSDVLLQATGYVTAKRQATVSAQMTGMLVEVHVEEGDRVERGQVLARLESRSHSASQRAAGAAALAAQAQVEQLRAEVDQASRRAKRQQELLQAQLVSREMAEEAQTEVTTMQARLRAAQLQAQSAIAQADMADVATANTEVKAPFSGVVIRKAAQVGEIVSPQSSGGFTRSGICTIVDMDSLEVDVDVNEAYIGRVNAGMPGEIILDAYPDWRIPARVVAIVPAADRSKATVRVRVGFVVKDSRIVPDMGARVSFLKQTDEAPRRISAIAAEKQGKAGAG
jgi:RND family efflux transporter MFP subunit